jgi:hypothetical protein
MRTHRPTETAYRAGMARRLLLIGALALALAIGIAGARASSAAPASADLANASAAAQAGPAQAGPARPAVRGDAATTARPVTDKGRASGAATPAPRGSSPVVPLVLAGIVILAAAGPWVPPGSRYVFYRVDRRW